MKRTKRTMRPVVGGGMTLALILGSVSAAGAANDSTLLRVNTRADTVDAAPGDGTCADAAGTCSFRAAVQEANASGVPTTIRSGGGVYQLTIAGAGEDDAATGDLDVTGTIQILSSATIDLAGFGDRAFDVAEGGSLSVRSLTVKNGSTPESESGGAFRSSGYLSLNRVRALDNTVTGAGASGGAVMNAGGELVVDTSTLSNNSAVRAGGAIEANAGVTTIIRSLLSENIAGATPGNGGAFHLTGAGIVNVDNSRILGNVASAEGGGLWNSGSGTMTIRGSQIRRNIANGIDADQGGGGLFNDGGTMSVHRTTVNLNLAVEGSGSGGGALNNGGSFTATASNFRQNEAARAGGGIETVAGTVDLTNFSLNSNKTGPRPGNGGGLHVSGAGVVTISNAIVQGNTASNEGGGLWNSAIGEMSIANVAIQHNKANGEAADNGGGGVFNQGNGVTGGTLTIVDSAIRNNNATIGSGSGGGVLNEQGTVAITNTTIEGNQAARAGGGIEVVGGTDTAVGTTTLTMVDLMKNSAGPRPGNGGGLHLTGNSLVEITNSRIIRNSAANEGGGVWNSPSGTMTLSQTEIGRNTVGVPEQGPNVFQKGPVSGGVLSVNGQSIAEGNNNR